MMTSSMPICCSRRRSVENCRPEVPSMPVTRLQPHQLQKLTRTQSRLQHLLWDWVSIETGLGLGLASITLQQKNPENFRATLIRFS